MAGSNTSDIAETRRRRLRQWIDENFAGSVNAFANSVDYKQPQIAETLKGKRSFGEKLARELESVGRMPPAYLDGGDAPSGGQQKIALWKMDVTIEGARVGQEWDKLRPDMQGFVQTMIEVLVAKQRTADAATAKERAKKPAKTTGKGKPREDRPDA